jgi:hypothetical protein
MAQGSFAPITDRDPAPLDQPINAHSGFLTDDGEIYRALAKSLAAIARAAVSLVASEVRPPLLAAYFFFLINLA